MGLALEATLSAERLCVGWELSLSMPLVPSLAVSPRAVSLGAVPEAAFGTYYLLSCFAVASLSFASES